MINNYILRFASCTGFVKRPRNKKENQSRVISERSWSHFSRRVCGCCEKSVCLLEKLRSFARRFKVSYCLIQSITFPLALHVLLLRYPTAFKPVPDGAATFTKMLCCQDQRSLERKYSFSSVNRTNFVFFKNMTFIGGCRS